MKKIKDYISEHTHLVNVILFIILFPLIFSLFALSIMGVLSSLAIELPVNCQPFDHLSVVKLASFFGSGFILSSIIECVCDVSHSIVELIKNKKDTDH